MRRITLHISAYLLIALVLAVLLIEPSAAFARAGGGGGRGRSGGGSLLAYAFYFLVYLPCVIVYQAIRSWVAARKTARSHRLLEQLARLSQAWDKSFLYERIQRCFNPVQKAWAARDQTLAKDFVSARLFRRHQAQLKSMTEENRRNVLEDVQLRDAQIVEVASHRDDSHDHLWVLMEMTMIDYTVDDRTGHLLSGSRDKLEESTELWKFCRERGGWVLDRIVEKVTIGVLRDCHSYSEHLQDAPFGSVSIENSTRT